MRVIAGKWHGHHLDAPIGQDTRPTTDRMRESVASAVWSDRSGLEGLSIFDAFAGSGAYSIEMLSRGASHATLCDTSDNACACIKRNLHTLGISRSQTTVLKCDVFLSAHRATDGAPFDIVFLDPPYATIPRSLTKLVMELGSRDLLSDGALVVYEHAPSSESLSCNNLELISTRTISSSTVDMYHWHNTPAPLLEEL